MLQQKEVRGEAVGVGDGLGSGYCCVSAELFGVSDLAGVAACIYSSRVSIR